MTPHGARAKFGIGRAADVALCVLCLLGLTACDAEKRAVGPQAPMTAPTSADDPRGKAVESNAYQVSQGGRLLRWHGCDQCHTETSSGSANLNRFERRYGGTTVQLYRSIAEGRRGGMPSYSGKITPEQIWQLAGYIHSLPGTSAAKRLRASAAQLGEGQDDSWAGPLP